MDNGYTSLAVAIIMFQESIIGPIAWIEARKVDGLNIKDREVQITGDGKLTLEKLVSQYENLFGLASVEACRDAVHPILLKYKDIDIPQILL